ncbi:MAG: MBL fold metallo-hydrolase [Muribaculaceae bacterium]|nr:MBL fold metallo-hydrolase [Muribaculaceae bacterium]
MLEVKQFVFNYFSENTFIVYDGATGQAIVIDPGMYHLAECKMFDAFIEANGLTIEMIVNTHMHLDHCFGDNYVHDKYNAKIAGHSDDANLGATLGAQTRQFGIRLPDDGKDAVKIDIALNEGDIITVGAYSFSVIAVPGHSPGGIVLYCEKEKLAFVGDSVFYGSIGRTDLPGGDYDTLIASLRTKILTLPDETQLLPGHDRYTTVAHEKALNPYLRQH